MPKSLIYVLSILVFVSISCQHFSNKPKMNNKASLKEGVEVSYMNWEYNLGEPTRLQNVQITLQNKSKVDLAKVRYRLHIYVYEGKGKREVFSKAYHYDNLFSGDVVKIPIHDLNNFSLDVPISNVTKWYWDAEIEKVK